MYTRTHIGAGLCAVTQSSQLIDYPSCLLSQREHRWNIEQYVNIWNFTTWILEAVHILCSPHTCTLRGAAARRQTHKGCSKRTGKCSGCNDVSTEHQVPIEDPQAVPTKWWWRQRAQNRGLLLWTVPVRLEVLFPSQQCGQKRPLVSPMLHEDFGEFRPLPCVTFCLVNSALVWLRAWTAAPTALSASGLICCLSRSEEMGSVSVVVFFFLSCQSYLSTSAGWWTQTGREIVH